MIEFLTSHPIGWIMQIFFGILIADAISAVGHWAQDNIGTPQTPIVGHIIRDGQRHHANPELFLTNTVWVRSGIVMIMALIFFVIGTLIFGWQVWIFSAAVAGGLMIEIQVYCHMPYARRPRWVRALQHIGLMQHPKQHEYHHAQPNRTLAVVTSWLNPWIDKALDWRDSRNAG